LLDQFGQLLHFSHHTSDIWCYVLFVESNFHVSKLLFKHRLLFVKFFDCCSGDLLYKWAVCIDSATWKALGLMKIFAHQGDLIAEVLVLLGV